jgi:hypothetical protein
MSVQMCVVGFVFLLMGLVAFARPRTFLTAYVGITAETPDARNEIQAVYGGFGVAMALVLCLPIWMPAAKTGIAIAVAAALGGMAFGRLVAFLREKPGRWPLIFFVVEAGGAALLLSAL